ncbi:hypothetical protein V0288_04120 [Pannus brasiliensis CCIBt3594]|uniref:Uncharacterized protein n=1 Tax=Pannus brasiliensis CCIBt3594 TaxID=1427578 RepID=A0AAW9QSI5_9CHRO
METITFEMAIERSSELLNEVDNLDPATVQREITELVATQNGARGFFVIYLPSDIPFADAPTPETIEALKTSPEIVGELLVKNLAMSTAMGVFHRRNADEETARGSDRVRERTAALIESLKSPEIGEKLQRLRETLETGSGEYERFLDRWGYDREQRQAIAEITRSVLALR